MLRYALRRLLLTIPTLFVIVTLAFFVMRLAPGGPFDQEQMLPPDVTAYHAGAASIGKGASEKRASSRSSGTIANTRAGNVRRSQSIRPAASAMRRRNAVAAAHST